MKLLFVSPSPFPLLISSSFSNSQTLILKSPFHIPQIFTTTTTKSSSISITSAQFRQQHRYSETEAEDEGDIDDEDESDDDDDEAAHEYELFGLNEDEEVEEGVVYGDEEGNGDVVVVGEGTKKRFEEFKWQRVERLRAEVKEFGEGIINLDELASIYDFRMDKFQRLAVQAFLRGSSVVVSAPTSSGKTLIAEAAAVATIAKGRRLFYTTPLKALSNQKFRDFRETFGDSNVGLLTGDSAVNKDAPILIMTTEILRNMLYQSVGMISSGSGLLHVEVIVLDEVHYLSDMSRGTVWEEVVIYAPKEVQLLCLSATVANADELAGWIGQIHGATELIRSTKRPVPLTWYFSTKNFLLPLLNENETSMNRKLSLAYMQQSTSRVRSYKEDGYRRKNSRKRESQQLYNSVANVTEELSLSKNDVHSIRRSQVPQVRDTLWHLRARDMLPAIWFIFSRKGCDASVQYLEESKLLDEFEFVEVELALKKFREQYPDAVRESAVKGLFQGVAAHHAGCLPLWKSFVEELFNRGLVKVVFATETLAAGINMPARTAVIASLSKRSDTGRIYLTSNELFQMAGRAGRRGIDEKGNVVLVQSSYDGAEECCKLLFAGVQPLVSQFTASYGMVLNLLAGAKVTRSLKETEDTTVSPAGRTLEEARKLVEQSFGNYVGSNVMVAAKEEVAKIEKEIEFLKQEIGDDVVDKKCRKKLSAVAYKEIFNLQEDLRAEKRTRTELRRRMVFERLSAIKPLLRKVEDGHLPFICLQHMDNEGIEHLFSVVYLGMVDSFADSKFQDMIYGDERFDLNVTEIDLDNPTPSYHVGLGSDNSWYLFTERWIKNVYRTGLPNVALVEGDPLPREILKGLLEKDETQFEKISNSDFGGLWRKEGSIETWSWTLNVPVLSSLPEDDELLHKSQQYQDSVESYRKQKNKVSRLKKTISRTEGFKEYKKIIDMTKFTSEKIGRLRARSSRLISRIEQIEPSGWKEFLQISNVILEARALDINTRVIFPLGETASAIRGENELWLAIVLRNKILLDLKPPQLAAVCGSLVSEGIRVRPGKDNSYIYEPSTTVVNLINVLEEQRSSFLNLQEKHGVKISCALDTQFSGMVEAWASGLTWKEIMMDCAMDEGDLARLLRRTIDLLAQIPKLPDIDPSLQRNAMAASNVMDRPPISELAG